MTAPIFQREGARIGGLTTTTISMVARTDSNGARLYCDVYTDSARTRLAASSSAGTLNSGNNYCTTVRVTGLQAGRKYWWRARADDGSSGSTNGDDATFSQGSFVTQPTSGSWRIGFWSCDPAGPNGGGYNLRKSAAMAQHMFAQRCGQLVCLGDFYYSDINTNNATADYTSGAWRNPGLTDANATLPAYRTNCISCLDAGRYRGEFNYKADLYRNTPLDIMWDDHDRGWDDMSGQQTWSASKITRAANAQQAGHEMFMALSAQHVINDGRTWTANSTQEDYFHFDVVSTRIIVLNCRTFRDLKGNTDTTSKTMLGATQKAWLKDKILNNPKRFLVIASPLMLDGYHGWNASTTDGWVSYSYERDEIIDYIRAHGDPARTLIVSGDTHAGAVCVHRVTRGVRAASTDIYEVMAGNSWPDSAHDYINGFYGGASGRGSELVVMRVGEPNMTVLDLNNTSMRVKMIETVTGRSVFDKLYV